jgi:hypothetical protein
VEAIAVPVEGLTPTEVVSFGRSFVLQDWQLPTACLQNDLRLIHPLTSGSKYDACIPEGMPKPYQCDGEPEAGARAGDTEVATFGSPAYFTAHELRTKYPQWNRIAREPAVSAVHTPGDGGQPSMSSGSSSAGVDCWIVGVFCFHDWN